MLPKFEIFGFTMFSYPLILGAIWAIGFEYAKALNKESIPHFKKLFVALFCASWIGAKLLFLLTLSESVAGQISQKSSFWLGGGFVFLGGLILGLVALFVHKKLTATNLKKYEFLILPLTLGHAIGRIGCFMAGCCYGTYCELPWAIHLQGKLRHPIQLYESLSLFIIFFWLRARLKKGKTLLIPYLTSYFVIRFVLEIFRGDKIRGIFFWQLSTSQLISVGGIFLILVVASARKVLDFRKG